MTLDMLVLAAIITASLILFILDVFPVDKVSVLVLGTLLATRLITPEQAIAGFGNVATITVACMLAISYGIQTTGVLNYMANKIVDLAGKSELRILFSIMIAVGILSAFINNTAAVALFLPLTIVVAREQRLDASRLLMPMAYTATMAGTCTLIGTSTNLLVHSLAMEHAGWRIGLFEFTQMGLIFFAAGFTYLLLIGHRLIPSRRSPDSLMQDYRLRHFVTELILQPDSPLIGKSIAETEFREKHGVEVIEILRDTTRVLPEAGETRIQAHDILLVQGDPHTLVGLQEAQKVAIKALEVEDRDLQDENILLVEAFISPTSRLIESTLKDVDFRRTFNANALAIRSHGRTIREKIGKIKLEYGDSLLILIDRDHLQSLRQIPDFMVVEEVRMPFLRKDKAYYTGAIFAGFILVATLEILTIIEAALLGTALMILTGSLRLRDLYNHISWQTIIMLACLIPLGTAMQNTGLANLLATKLVDVLVGWGPVAVLSGVYLMTSLMTSLMSNNATAVLMLPIGLSVAAQLQADPKPFILAVMFAASAEFMTPIGYQTNLFIFGPGGYKFQDYMKVGAPLNFLFWLLASIFIPIFWPL